MYLPRIGDRSSARCTEMLSALALTARFTPCPLPNKLTADVRIAAVYARFIRVLPDRGRWRTIVIFGIIWKRLMTPFRVGRGWNSSIALHRRLDIGRYVAHLLERRIEQI